MTSAGPSGLGPATGHQLSATADDLPATSMPGRDALSAAALIIGLLLMALQLWLLTVALELFLSGKGTEVWLLALISGLIFAGGLGILWLLRRHPSMRRGLPNVPARELL